MPTIVPVPAFMLGSLNFTGTYYVGCAGEVLRTYQHNGFPICISYRSWIRVEHQETAKCPTPFSFEGDRPVPTISMAPDGSHHLTRLFGVYTSPQRNAKWDPLNATQSVAVQLWAA